MTPPRRWLLVTLIASTAICVVSLNRGWEPVGEGAIGQAAERVLHGEVPHRDFDDLYTGLLTYIHAAAFAIGGVRLSILRVPLLLATVAWVATFFAVARRVVSPASAALLTLLALLWSVPNDPSPMPSWYNLFCATFGIYALARWIEERRARWIALAGVFGALSFLMKLSGLFLLAGLGLFLIEASRPSGPASPRDKANTGLRAAVILGLVLFVALLWRSVAPRGSRGVAHFVLPVALMVLGLAVREWTAPAVSARVRVRALVQTLAPLFGAATLVIGGFAAFLAVVGGLDEAIRGVFITSFQRMQYAGMQPPRAFWLAAVLPLALLLRPRTDHLARAWRVRSLWVAVLLAGALVAASVSFFPQQVIWQSLRSLAPFLGLVVGVVLAVGSERLAWPPARRELVILLCMVAVLHSLIQFPFAGPNYFYYVAPLVFLAAAGIVAVEGRTPAGVQVAVAGFYLVFAILEVLPGSPSGLALLPGKRPRPVPVDVARVGLRVAPAQAALYEAFVPFLTRTAADGRIWAGPEAPHVYFLGGFQNRSRALYSFLDSVSRTESGLIERLERDRIGTIVINTRPSFSPRLPDSVVDSLSVLFPNAERFGPFVVRWR